MTELLAALYRFWAQFGIPAYLDDQVPDDAELPYIVYSVSRGPAMEATWMTAYNYHRRADGGNRERAQVADRIAEVIGEGGVKVPVEGKGYVVLRRNDDFQTPYQDPSDHDVIGMRNAVEMYMYMA